MRPSSGQWLESRITMWASSGQWLESRVLPVISKDRKKKRHPAPSLLHSATRKAAMMATAPSWVAGMRPPSSNSRRMGEGAWLEGLVEHSFHHSYRPLTSELHLCENNEFLSAVSHSSVVFFWMGPGVPSLAAQSNHSWCSHPEKNIIPWTNHWTSLNSPICKRGWASLPQSTVWIKCDMMSLQ